MIQRWLFVALLGGAVSWWAGGSVGVGSAGAQAASDAAWSASLESDVAALTRGPHRLSGTAEAAAAAEFIRRRLEAMGVPRVLEQRFDVVQVARPRVRFTLRGVAADEGANAGRGDGDGEGDRDGGIEGGGRRG